MLTGVHDELTLDGPHPVLLVLGEQLVAGNHEGVHVGDGAPWGEDTVPAAPPDDFPHFLEIQIFWRAFYRKSSSLHKFTFLLVFFIYLIMFIFMFIYL